MVRDLRAAELFRVCSRISGKKRRSLCRLLPASAKRGLASKAPASEFVVYLYIDYVSRACYDGHPCSSRGVFRRRSIGGARCGVLRLRLVTAPREVRGPRPPSTTTWLRGARCTGCGGNAADGSAAPGHKSPRWSAERRASYVTGRRAPRKRPDALRHCASHRVPLHPGACRRSAHPSGVGIDFTPRARMRRGNELGCVSGCLTSEDVNAVTCSRAPCCRGKMALSPCGRGQLGADANPDG